MKGSAWLTLTARWLELDAAQCESLAALFAKWEGRREEIVADLAALELRPEQRARLAAWRAGARASRRRWHAS